MSVQCYVSHEGITDCLVPIIGLDNDQFAKAMNNDIERKAQHTNKQ